MHRALIAERELALGLAHYALVRTGCSIADANATIEERREGLTRVVALAGTP